MSDTVPSPAVPAENQGHGMRFKIGIFLLIFNIPFGYGGAAIVMAIASSKGRPGAGAVWGIIVYAISWAMLGMGVLLTGKEGLAFVKKLKADWFARFRKNPPSTP